MRPDNELLKAAGAGIQLHRKPRISESDKMPCGNDLASDIPHTWSDVFKAEIFSIFLIIVLLVAQWIVEE